MTNQTKGQVVLAQLIDYLGINMRTLANKVGLKYNRLTDIRRGKTEEFSFEVATKICAVYPDINIEWLFGKDENMLVRNIGNSNIKPRQEDDASGNPYFMDFTMQGGYGHGVGNEQAILPDGYMSVPGIQPSTEIPFIQVRGKSMLNVKDPSHSIPPGSWVAVKRVVGNAIRWGEVYAVQTTDGPIVKRLMPSDNADCVRCVSFNDEYPPFDLPTTDIVDGAIYIVKGVVNVQVWN